jgi:hypothetical protein
VGEECATLVGGMCSMPLQCIELCFLLQKVRVSTERMEGKIMIRGHIIDLQVSMTVVCIVYRQYSSVLTAKMDLQTRG